MLSPGDRVRIRYRDATGDVTEDGWTVIEYDDALVKLKQPDAVYREGSEPDLERVLPGRVMVVNLRCFNFLSVEVQS
jgi:hypothetical protein